METTTLADRLRWILERRRLSMKALSEIAGLAPGHVGLIVRGTVKGAVTPETLRKLAQAGGVAYEWLATGNGSPEVSATPAPRETVVERDPGMLVPEIRDDETVIERTVVMLGASESRYRLADVDAARAAARASSHWIKPDTDVAVLARSYLNAAKWLRENGETLNVTNVSLRAAIDRSNASPEHVLEASARENEIARKELEALRAPPVGTRAASDKSESAKKSRKH
jgi:transcriptional regulator with XRE-family HTH domain